MRTKVYSKANQNNNSQYITINYQSEAFENNLNSKKKPHSLLVFSLPICSRPKTKYQKLIQETYSRNLFKKFIQENFYSFFRPTSGCLQYHTGVTGRIETFNFNTAAGSHLPNQE